MRVIFNNEAKSFPIRSASENFYRRGGIFKPVLTLNFSYSEEFYNELIEYFSNNINNITNIKIYNEIDELIFNSSKYNTVDQLFRSVDDSMNYIQVTLTIEN